MKSLLDRNVVTFQNLAFTPPGSQVALFQNLSLTLAPGELVLLRGANGSGKSSCLRLLAQKLAGLQQSGSSDRPFFYLPQLTSLYIHMNLTLLDGIRALVGQQVSGLANIANIRQAVKDIGLLNDLHLDLPWDGASGGERQRALLTAGLLSDAAIYLWDEPSNHLDLKSTRLLRDQMSRRLTVFKQSFVVVCHEDTELLALQSIPGITTKTLQFDGQSCQVQSCSAERADVSEVHE